MGLGFNGLGFWDLGLGFRVLGVGFRIPGPGGVFEQGSIRVTTSVLLGFYAIKFLCRGGEWAGGEVGFPLVCSLSTGFIGLLGS